MYGKLFCSMYEGSMIGSGPTVFAVWAYCIVKADPEDHTVALNPTLLSTLIGTTEDDIKQAIMSLTSPDEHSRCREHDGRRLLNIGGFEYFVVTHEFYRNIGNNDDRRTYNRLMKRRERERRKMSLTVNDTQRHTAYAYASSSLKEGDARGRNDPPGFVSFWQLWPRHPRKVNKKGCLAKWKRDNLEAKAEQIMAGLNAWMQSDQWQKDGGAYIPAPMVFLNQERWADMEAARAKSCPQRKQVRRLDV